MSKAAQIRQFLAENPGYNRKKAADKFDTSERYVYLAMERQKEEPEPRIPFTIAEPPPQDIPLEDLLSQKVEAFKIYKKYSDYAKLIQVDVHLDGPFAIAHLGDPHIDSDGCDIETLMRHVDIINRTEGMFAANVGDISDNWTGRLAHLWGQSNISERNSWRLVEWFVGSMDWLYLVGGNHNAWSGDKDPIKWIVGEVGNYGPSSVRLVLKCPNGKEIIVNARHDFKGYSQWNPAHGSMKAAQMGFRDHILTNGHKHVSGYGLCKCPATGRISHCIQVATYKAVDAYADEKGFLDHNISPCAVTVIDPYAEHERDLVVTMWSLSRAAEYLNFLRKRFNEKCNPTSNPRKAKSM